MNYPPSGRWTTAAYLRHFKGRGILSANVLPEKYMSPSVSFENVNSTYQSPDIYVAGQDALMYVFYNAVEHFRQTLMYYFLLYP